MTQVKLTDIQIKILTEMLGWNSEYCFGYEKLGDVGVRGFLVEAMKGLRELGYVRMFRGGLDDEGYVVGGTGFAIAYEKKEEIEKIVQENVCTNCGGELGKIVLASTSLDPAKRSVCMNCAESFLPKSDEMIDHLERLFPKGDRSRGKASVLLGLAVVWARSKVDERDNEWIEAVVNQPPMFVKSGGYQEASDRARLHRRIRCVEILKKMGENREADILLSETIDLGIGK